MGLDLNYFWTLTPKQWGKYVKVFKEKEEERFRENDILNYILGQYVAFGVNDPKHYPNKPFTEKKQNLKPSLSSNEMEKVAMFNTKLMGGVIK